MCLRVLEIGLNCGEISLKISDKIERNRIGSCPKISLFFCRFRNNWGYFGGRLNIVLQAFKWYMIIGFVIALKDAFKSHLNVF